MEEEDRTIEDWKQTLNINLIAPFILTKLIEKEMVKNKCGAIINISSTNGINTYYPTSVDYNASKSRLISLTYNSAVELAPYVRVNCIGLGWVNTEMIKELPEDFVKEETERILVKRFAEPEEIAKVATFLASDDASFINSTIIKVGGTNFVAELLQGNEFKVIGGCHEKFKDCLFDIEGAINFVKEKNYE